MNLITLEFKFLMLSSVLWLYGNVQLCMLVVVHFNLPFSCNNINNNKYNCQA